MHRNDSLDIVFRDTHRSASSQEAVVFELLNLLTSGVVVYLEGCTSIAVALA